MKRASGHILWSTRFLCVWLFSLMLLLLGCRQQPEQPIGPGTPAEVEPSGEDLVAAAIDEIVGIAEWADGGASGGAATLGACRLVPSSLEGLQGLEGDSVRVYGEVTPDGYGAVVTERHTHPKGILLITVRKSYGRAGRIVSEIRRYISDHTLIEDLPEQTVTTEILPLSRDTILTYVMRSGAAETYTFRLPVVTRTADLINNTVRVTSRFARNGAVVSEVTDGGGALVKRTLSIPQPTGALLTRTEMPDGSWRSVSTLGRADGSVLREVTTGH